MDPTKLSPKEQQQFARSNGFQSYDQMLAWAKQREALAGPAKVVAPSHQMPGILPRGVPMKSAGEQALSWHPAKILQYIGDKLSALNNR